MDNFARLKTPVITIRELKLGGNYPIMIQSMTNTDTEDAEKTAKQCMELADAGSEMVRITVNTEKAAQKIGEIRKRLDEGGCKKLPLIGDFHYNGHILLAKYPKCAAALDKYRINPGNVGYGDKHDYNFRSMIKMAIEHNKPIRIGVNWGSLDRELLTDCMNANAKKARPKKDKEVIIDAMVESALRSAQLAEKEGLQQNKIVLSVKMSEVQDVVKAYELLARRMKNHCYAIHLGLTEAGMGIKGVISSSAALAILLQKGIGDTIRISLTPKPTRPRTEEVLACKELLQALGLRHFKAQVTSCPGCGRAENNYYQHLAYQVNKHIDSRMPYWEKHYPKVKTLKIAVMGCIVNGPGEATHADIGISLPGKSEKPQAQIFEKSKFIKTLSGNDISEQFIQYLEKFVQHYCK